jgi:hypothetical protein
MSLFVRGCQVAHQIVGRQGKHSLAKIKGVKAYPRFNHKNAGIAQVTDDIMFLILNCLVITLFHNLATISW